MVQIEPADRLMNSVRALPKGIEVTFADGRSGVIPFGEIRGIDGKPLADIKLPSQHEIVLLTTAGESVDIPWDFARHYCDPSYQAKAEAIASRGRGAMGRRIRRLRKRAGMTQEQLATAASIGRVTLVRIENGEQSPRFETLTALADALHRPVAELLVDDIE
jgi:DNA-binding XRE family transcriptional regulator